MSDLTQLAALSAKLDAATPDLTRLDRAYRNESPGTYLSDRSRSALSGSVLHRLGVAYPWLIVSTLAARLSLVGFRADGVLDAAVWQRFRRAGGEQALDLVHADALVSGQGYALVWSTPDGRARVTAESPLAMSVQRDPATGEPTAALKRYAVGNRTRAVLYGPDRVTTWEGPQTPGVPVSAAGWQQVGAVDNPLGVCPVVPVTARARASEVDGASDLAPVLPLVDALNRLVADLMVAAEFYAKPRRWATGLEVPVDENGKRLDPIANLSEGNFLVARDAAVNFGQWDASDLASFEQGVGLITRMIAALGALPPNAAGIASDVQPSSADAIRASEATLTQRAEARMRAFGPAWARVAALVVAVDTGVYPAADLTAQWSDPATRSPASDSDSLLKLVSAGLPLSAALTHALGWTPEAVQVALALPRTEAPTTPAALPALPATPAAPALPPTTTSAVGANTPTPIGA